MFITEQKRKIIFDMKYYNVSCSEKELFIFLRSNIGLPYSLGRFKDDETTAMIYKDIKKEMREWRRTLLREIFRIPTQEEIENETNLGN